MRRTSYHRYVTQAFEKRDVSLAPPAFHATERQYVLASFRRVGIAVWIEEAPVQAIREAQRMVERLAAEWPDGVGFMQVIGEDCQTIDLSSRLALRDLLVAGQSHIREAPVVYEGSGFRAAAVRAIVTGIIAQRSLGFPHRVYGSIEEGALAIAHRFEKREPSRYARELCEALARIRDRHKSAFPSAPQSFIRYRGSP